MKKLVLYLLLFSNINSLSAQTDFQHKEDSLKKVIAESSGQDKLNAIAYMKVLKNGTNEVLYYAKLLEQEAIKENDNTFINEAYQFQAEYYFSINKVDSYFCFFDKVRPYVIENKYFDDLFLMERLGIELYLQNGSFEFAQDRIEKMRAESKKYQDKNGELQVYSSLGSLYIQKKRFQDAIDVLKKQRELAWKLEGSGGMTPELNKINTYLSLAEATIGLKDFPLALLYCDSIHMVYNDVIELQKNGDYLPGSFDLVEFTNRLYYSIIYTEFGKLDEAKKYKDEIDASEFFKIMPSPMMDRYNLAFANFYFKKKQYGDALRLLEQAIRGYIETNQPSYIEALDLQIKIVEAMGNNTEANKLYKELLKTKESIAQNEMTKQASQIRALYKIDKLEMEAQEKTLRQERLNIIIISISLTCFLLVTLLIFIRRKAEELKEKNKHLFEQLQATEQLEKDIQEQREANSSNKTPENSSINLFKTLEEYLRQTKCFTENDLSRENLATRIGSNYKYLCDSIQENKGQSFNEYINDHRLQYARNLLNDEAISIEMVHIISGFTSKSTFYRLFKLKYSMNPSEMRVVIREKKNISE